MDKNLGKLKVVFTGGGTAGHLFPNLSVIAELKKLKPKAEILYIGSKKGFEAKYLKKTDIPFVTIPTGKIRKYFDFVALFHNLYDLLKIPFGFLKSLFVLLRFRPDIIFIKGGYVSLPVGLAGIVLRIPFLVHESDFHMGVANRFLVRFAQKVAVSFPNKFYPGLAQKKLIFSGNPIRSEILKGNKEEAYKIFNLERGVPVILVIGGSQGARKINLAVCDKLSELVKRYQLIHMVGWLDWETVRKANHKLDPKLQKRHKIFKFLEKDLAFAYAVADLVVSRGGANVLAEISAWEKPSILIAIPGHQAKNAMFYLESGASTVIENEKLNGETLLGEIESLFKDSRKMKKMAFETSKLAHKDAAHKLAKELLKLRI